MEDNTKAFPNDVSVSKGMPWPPHDVLVPKVRRSSIWASFAAITAGVSIIIGLIAAIFFREEAWGVLYAIHPAVAYTLTSLFLLIFMAAGILVLVEEVKSPNDRSQYQHRMVMPYWYHLSFACLLVCVPAYWLLNLIFPDFIAKLEPLNSWIGGLGIFAMMFMLWAERKGMRPVFRWVLYFIIALVVLVIFSGLYLFVTKGS